MKTKTETKPASAHTPPPLDSLKSEVWRLRTVNADLREGLDLIVQSDTFNGGTFVKELQDIARNAIKKAGAPDRDNVIPDLLAACEAARNVFEGQRRVCDAKEWEESYPREQKAWDELKAAIAKAGGRA